MGGVVVWSVSVYVVWCVCFDEMQDVCPWCKGETLACIEDMQVVLLLGTAAKFRNSGFSTCAMCIQEGLTFSTTMGRGYNYVPSCL